MKISEVNWGNHIDKWEIYIQFPKGGEVVGVLVDEKSW
jgi:hypothetical protein